MRTLLVGQAPKRGRVCLMLGISLLAHSGLVGIAALWTAPEPLPRTVVIDIGFDTPPGNPNANPPTVQTIPAETPDSAATPDVLSKADPIPPEPESSPDFAQPPESTPPRKVNQLRTSKTPNSRVSTSARSLPGQSNNVAPGGLPGSPANAVGTWLMPHPSYPRTITALRPTGSTVVRITTDASGQVSSVVIVKSAGSPILDHQTESFVRMNWHGPPNASRTTEFVYQIR